MESRYLDLADDFNDLLFCVADFGISFNGFGGDVSAPFSIASKRCLVSLSENFSESFAMTEEPKIRIGDARPLTTPDYLKMLSEQSEAGNALVLAGLVEDWLQKLLMHSTRSLSNTLATKIYDGYGPLSQFSQKIEIAYIFELIDENVYDELRAIKEIRNRFAHTTVFRNFKSEEVAKECQRLKGWKKNGDNQMLYLERTKACVEAISKKISLKILVGALKDAPGVDDRTLPDR